MVANFKTFMVLVFLLKYILLTNNLNITKLTIWDVPIYFILPLPLVLNRMTYCNLKTHCEKLICNHALDKTIRYLLCFTGFMNASLTEDRRQLSSWGLPEPVLEAYRRLGVTTMFQWQAECLLTGKALGRYLTGF